MRKLQVFYLIITLAICSSCKKESTDPTLLNISVTQQPIGGSRVGQLSVKFEGQIVGPPKTMQVTGEWWWSDEKNEKSSLMDSRQFIFDSNNISSCSAYHSAPQNYFLFQLYWFRITWTDDKGLHVLESNKAICNQ